MGEDNNLSFSAVEIITQAYVVVGRCVGLTEQTRLIDLLNSRDFTHVQLIGAKVRGLAHSGDVAAVEGSLSVDRTRIVFASTLESPEQAAKRREAHRIDCVEKAKHPILVFASPFRILGNAYLVKGADPKVALPKLFDGFLAMTDTKAVHESGNGLAWENDFLVVNGRRMDMVCSAPPHLWRADEFASRAAAHVIDDLDLEEVFGLSERG